MNIRVRLFATLREGRGKELNIAASEGCTVLSVLDRLVINRSDVALLLINGRDGAFETQLSDGDTVSLFPPVGGG